VIETPKLVLEAIAGDVDVLHVFVGYDARGLPSIMDACAGTSIEVFGLKPSAFESWTDAKASQGVIAVATSPSLDFDDRFDASDSATDQMLVALDVSDPGNLGTLIRTAEAAGCKGVVVAGSSVDVLSPKVVRSSAGSVLRIPLAEVTDDLVNRLHAYGYSVIAATMDGQPYDQMESGDRSVAWVLGSEAHGVPDDLLGAVDDIVSIPMFGSVESLNVGTAGSVLAFDHARRRRSA